MPPATMSPSHPGPHCNSCFHSIAFCFGGASEKQPADSYWNQGAQSNGNATEPPKVLYINKTLAAPHPPTCDKLRLCRTAKPLSCHSSRAPSISKEESSTSDAGPSQPDSASHSIEAGSPQFNRQDGDQLDSAAASASSASSALHPFAPMPMRLQAAPGPPEPAAPQPATHAAQAAMQPCSQPTDVPSAPTPTPADPLAPAPTPCTSSAASQSSTCNAAHAEVSSCVGSLASGDHGSWDEDDDFCPTCLDFYTPENPKVLTACAHHYHMPCIYEWMERKDTCPICEAKMLILE